MAATDIYTFSLRMCRNGHTADFYLRLEIRQHLSTQWSAKTMKSTNFALWRSAWPKIAYAFLIWLRPSTTENRRSTHSGTQSCPRANCVGSSSYCSQIKCKNVTLVIEWRPVKYTVSSYIFCGPHFRKYQTFFYEQIELVIISLEADKSTSSQVV